MEYNNGILIGLSVLISIFFLLCLLVAIAVHFYLQSKKAKLRNSDLEEQNKDNMYLIFDASAANEEEEIRKYHKARLKEGTTHADKHEIK